MLRTYSPAAAPGGRPTAASRPPMATALRTTWEALRQGLAAARRYQRLTAMGMPHDPALRQTLGAAPARGDVEPASARPNGDRACAGHGSGLPAAARVGNLAYVA
jgi:hypothetical protein